MSVARLRARLAKIAARRPAHCRCDHDGAAGYTPTPDDGPGLRALCQRCGGFYTLFIVEVVDEAPPFTPDAGAIPRK